MKIVKAEYISDYKVKLFFSDKRSRIVDFGGFILSSTYATFAQYKDLKKFKKFRIENGNIVWGKDWDLIFPLTQLYKGEIKIPRSKYRIDHTSSIAAEPRVRYGKK
jgi:hypothetical protein